MFDFKRGLAISAAVALMLTSFAGCGGKLNPVKKTSGTTSDASGSEISTASDGTVSNTESTTNSLSSNGTVTGTSTNNGTSGKSTGGTTTSKSNYVEPKFDLKGRVIKIGSEGMPDLTKKTIFSESVKLTEKKFNCKFKFIQKSDYFGLYQTLINDHAAGAATYDVVELRGYDVYPNAANSGAVLPVNKYYDFANDPTWQQSNFKDLGVFKGNRYGIPYTPNEVGEGIWYNRGLLRKFNVPDLWTYVEKNQWNWTTFRAVCKKLTNDTNGDGKPDYWAFTANDPFLSFIFANNGTFITSGVNGAPKIALDSKASIEAIQYITDLHVIDNTIPDGAELGKITDSPFNAMFTGKVAMYPYHARYGAVLLARGIPSSDIGWIYYPKGSNATNYCTVSSTMPNMYVIPTAVSKPNEVVAAIQDLAAYWDTNREIKHNVSDATDELYDALKTSLDSNAKKVFYAQAQNPVYTLVANYNLSQILQNQLWPDILTQKATVKSAIDKYKSAMQQDLTKKYNG